MSAPPPPPAVVGRYRILDEIGRGAMGSVYRAHDPNTDRTVALKMLTVDGAIARDNVEQMHARFLREARAAGRLAHPGIVAVYDADIDAATGAPYLAMELVEGRSLAELLDEIGVLDWREAIRIAAAIADALQHADERGVVHRDLKPANVLLTSTGDVKVSDFGVALLVDDSSTVTGVLRGTPSYMAPEQVRGGQLDGRTDLYALGAVLYEMLTGEPPFRADSAVGIAHQVVHDDPRPPSFAQPDLPLALERLVLRAMAKRPADRFAYGRELAAALRAVAEPPAEEATRVQPRPAETMPSAAAPAAAAPAPVRHSRTALLATVAVVSLLAALALGHWLGRSRGPDDVGSRPPAVEREPSPVPPSINDAPPSQPAAPAAAADSDRDARTPRIPAEPTAPPPAPAQPASPPAAAPVPARSAAPASHGTQNAPAKAARPTSAPAVAESPPEPAAPAPDAASPEAAAPEARIELHFVNRIRDGTLTVSIDGVPVWSTPLESPANPFRRIGGEELIGFVPVPAGQRSIEVHVVNASEKIDSASTIDGEIAAGETRILRAVLPPFRGRLRLKWEP